MSSHYVVERPYGSWPSAIHATQLTSKSVRLGEPQITDSASYWIESRPSEKGRCVLMQQAHDNQEPIEVLPSTISVHSRAHEYGGASYLACAAGLFYVDGQNQRIYEWKHNSARALTPIGAYRYADLHWDATRNRVLAVREDHRAKQAGEAGEETNELICIDLTSGNINVLVKGHDFFSNPRVSPNGEYISWLSWDHPHMPWDSSQCWLATLGDDGQPIAPMIVAGFEAESVFQPQWSPDNQLFLVSDRNDWWNLYRCNPKHPQQPLEAITTMNAEFATPQWVFGMSTYGFLSTTDILACYSQRGQWQLAIIDTTTHTITPQESPFTTVSQIQCRQGRALFLAASATTAPQLIQFDGGHMRSIAKSSSNPLPSEWISLAQPMTFTTGEGTARAHGFYYPPTNPEHCGPDSDLPPLIVMCHGGPTGATETGLNLKIQYWTSRGFAVVDVNYRGSTGYGRYYREQLNGAWGLHDVEDACAAADHLIDLGKVDKDKIAIRGSSAGGYTVLAALTFSNRFTAGASLYGIGDLKTLATDTHKFEARYLDSLVGPYPQQQALYHQRSPIHHADKLSCPVIFFQGLDDKVVPPNQAEAMVAALDEKQIPVAYVPFKGEGHGFRGAEAIQRSLEAEWSFYGQVFGFDVDDDIKAVEVRHL